MRNEDIGKGTVLNGHITLERELGRTDKVCVYLAYDAQHAGSVGVTLFFEKPSDYVEEKALLKEALYLVRFSDFGSPSNQRFGTRKGQVYYADSGYEYGIWFQEWFVIEPRLTHPYRGSEFSTATRKALLHVANGSCQLCGIAGRLEVDHIVPVAFDGTADLENGLVLCKTCHQAKTTIQARCRRLPKRIRQFPNTPRRYYSLNGKQFLENQASIYVSEMSPYYLKLFDQEARSFASKRDMWLWITTHAKELIELLT